MPFTLENLNLVIAWVLDDSIYCFVTEIAIFQTTFSKLFVKKIKRTGSNKSKQGGKKSQNN